MPKAVSYRTCPEVSDACPVSATTYGYYPNLGVNSFFAALFGLLLLLQLGLGVRTRTWTYTAALLAGSLLEFLGYIGRILMHQNPWNEHGFEMQICCLVLGPSFIAASIYLTVKHIVLYCGPQHSLLRPNLYPWVFIGCDFASIVLQALGGGVAAAGSNKNSRSTLEAGNHLIVAGIAFQVATMAACGLLVLVFFICLQKAKRTATPDNEKSDYERTKGVGKVALKLRISAFALILAYTTVLIRCIYRLPEMAGGWGNELMRKETEFLLLDGMMIAIATLVLTVLHPGYLFPPFERFRSKESPSSAEDSS